MGKCVSRHQSILTISLSEKDLATASQIWSKFAASTEYIALKDEQGNQLCEYYYVSNGNGGGVKLEEQYQKENKKKKQQHQQGKHKQKNSQRQQAKSGQCTTEEIEYDDRNIVIAAAASTAATTAVAAVVAGNANDAHYVVGNSTNNSSHHDGQHCLAHLRLLQFEREQLLYNVTDEQQQQHDTLAASNDFVYVVAAADVNNNNQACGVNVVLSEISKNGVRENSSLENYDEQKILEASNSHESICENGDDEQPVWQRRSDFFEGCGGNGSCNSISEVVKVAEDIVCGIKHDEGQTESKKSAKKHAAGGMETKGTAMSFGFRKKLNTTPKKLKKLIEGESRKKQDKCNNLKKDGGAADGSITVGKRDIVVESNEDEYLMVDKDDNGNTGGATPHHVHFEKMGAAVAETHKQQQAQREVTATTPTIANQGASEQITTNTMNRPGIGNRFGYRGCHVRPASTGLTPRYQTEFQDNLENNNHNNNNNSNRSGNATDGQQNTPNAMTGNLKRRSKSAHAGRALTSNEAGTGSDETTAAPKITQPKSITFNLNRNSTIEYQRRQFFDSMQHQSSPVNRGRTTAAAQQRLQQQYNQHIVNTGLHTNVIVRPTPRAPPASYARFTLQTVSLPRPEFPVAISLSANTPTTPSSSFSPSPLTSTSSGARGRSTTTINTPHPLTVAQSTAHMDSKSVKQIANNTRRGFSGSREISADSGIASMDMAMDSSSGSSGIARRTASPKRSRSRPRNLQMIMNGKGKFEIRDLDDPVSSESNSFVETLALPKLPIENQTAPLPLSGLVRSKTVLSRETFERRNIEENAKPFKRVELPRNNSSEESESIGEEKLYLDRSASEKSAKFHQQFRESNTCSSKTSSPGSSIMQSWGNNAGESLAAKDCTNFSISSYDDSNKIDNKTKDAKQQEKEDLEDMDDLVTLNTDMEISTMSLGTETASLPQMLNQTDTNDDKPERPKTLYNTLNETKFAEIAKAGSEFLLEDETSPAVSLISSTESDDGGCKQLKHKINEQLQEDKDIDEISPELETSSPFSPGTPTHASRSLSLSDCGNLIDDEIADQPALLFNNKNEDGGESVASCKNDTPTLMDTTSLRSFKSQSKARTALQQAIELSLRTPLSVRKAMREQGESVDTLSPCDSICSDDLMMDFDINSSVDSIDRSNSNKSRSGSDLHKIDDTELFSELDRKGSDVMQELNSLLRTRSTRRSGKESVIAQLPARATRLLNRSRLDQQQQSPLHNDSDSSKSAHSTRRRPAAATRASSASTTSNNNAALQRSQHLQQCEAPGGSADDLMLHDKSFRNAMIQDVLQFKKQLLRLRRILQEDEEWTETINPFENDNGQLFAACGLDGKCLDDIDLASLTSSTTDDPIQELNDLRRQVVYLQGEINERDRTIRLQKNLIEKLEAEKFSVHQPNQAITRECINTATQTERTRTLAPEGLSRTKPEYTSYTTHFPALCNETTTIIQHHQQKPPPSNTCNNNSNNIISNHKINNNNNSVAQNQTRRHTIISTTLTNYNHQQLNAGKLATPRRASIAWEQHQTQSVPYKPVRITLIGEPLKQWNEELLRNAKMNGNHAVLESKKNLLNGIGITAGECKENGDTKQINGYHETNGCNGVSEQQLQQQQHQHTNGNLIVKPTVTIV